MKIGIIGYGFVGKALEKGFLDNVDILKIDPNLNTDVTDLVKFKPDAVFICVPTPMNEDLSQDISILQDIISKLKIINLNCLIVLKSTVLPNHIAKLEKLLPKFIFNPEFLREKHANDDFINSKLIVFGGQKKYSQILANIYKNHTKCLNTDYVYTDAIAASLIKYSINSFLATKVSFFNELNSLFKKSGTEENWKNFTNALSDDPRIGNSHMDVPGHDGRLGFGGACLPKDTNALYQYSKELGEDLYLLKQAIISNNKIRDKYNTRTIRELEQNIKFTGDE